MSLSIERKLRRLTTQETGSIWKGLFEASKEFAISVLETTREIFSSRYTWQAVSGLSLALVVLMYFGVFQRKPEDYAKRIVGKVAESIVTVKGMDANRMVIRQGAGLIIDSRGFIAVPLQLVAEIASGEAILSSGASYPIRGVIGTNPNSNLAVIGVSAPGGLKAAKLADLGEVQAGERVIAVSKQNHRGFQIVDGKLGGIIPNPRARSREVDLNQARLFIPADPMHGGVLQGTLINLKGEVISINTVSLEGEKAGLVIPIDVKDMLRSTHALIPLEELKYKSHPPEAVWYYIKGVLADDSGNTDEAIKYYEKCLEIDPSYDPAHVALGGMYHLKKDYEMEIFHYREAIRLNPTNTDARFNLAASYEDKGQYDLAIKEYEQVLAIKPNDEDTRKNLGIDYLVMGRMDKAVEQHEALKEINEGAANDLKKIIDLASGTRRE